MHIGLLTSELGHGNGWAHYSHSLLHALQAHGLHLSVISARNDTQTKLARRALLPTVTPPDRLSLGRMALNYPRLRRLLRTCDLIHSTVEPYAPLAIALAGQRPAFITIHGSYAHLPRIRRWPISRLYRHAYEQAQLVCVSPYTEQVVQRLVPTARTTVIHNGVDAARFADLTRQPAGRPTILTVGGVKRRKGTLELIQALAVVRQRLPDVQCIIIGTLNAEPSYVQQVREAIATHNLTPQVQLLGFVDEDVLHQWYAAAHVFVLPSINVGWKFEGFGLVHLEASAAGLPVIGTTQTGAEAAIEHGITGLLVEQAQVAEALPQAIMQVLQNPQLAQQMRIAGRAKAQRQTWGAVAAQLISQYEAALRT